MWWQKGERPTLQRDQGFLSAWIIGAICPARDTGAATVMSGLNTAVMTDFLAEVSANIAPGAHAVLVMDRAGWHRAKALKIPPNLSLIFLPPYSPELNPIERLWLYLKENSLTGRLYEALDQIIEDGCEAWNQVRAVPGLIKSICDYPWIKQV